VPERARNVTRCGERLVREVLVSIGPLIAGFCQDWLVILARRQHPCENLR
jgi:hypothetical protein